MYTVNGQFRPSILVSSHSLSCLCNDLAHRSNIVADLTSVICLRTMYSSTTTTEAWPHVRTSALVIGNYRDEPDSMALNEMTDSFGPMFDSYDGKKRERSMASRTIMRVTSGILHSFHFKMRRMLVYVFVMVLLAGLVSLFRIRAPGILEMSSPNQVTSHAQDQHPSKHRIEVLVNRNELEFQTMVQRQSESLEEAVREYRRRYHRRPPSGFARWYELAMERHFVLIDEWDTMISSLEPCSGLNPITLAARVQSRLALSGVAEMTSRKNASRMTRQTGTLTCSRR